MLLLGCVKVEFCDGSEWGGGGNSALRLMVGETWGSNLVVWLFMKSSELKAEEAGEFFSLSGRTVWNIELTSACSYPAAPGGATWCGLRHQCSPWTCCS